MTRFLFGLATGLGASAIAFVSIVASYNLQLVDALGYYIFGTVIAALAAMIAAMIVAMIVQVRAGAEARQLRAAATAEDDWS